MIDFFLLSNIWKDAEFHALSEYVTSAILIYFYSEIILKKAQKKEKTMQFEKAEDNGGFYVLDIFFCE